VLQVRFRGGSGDNGVEPAMTKNSRINEVIFIFNFHRKGKGYGFVIKEFGFE
jgi:hypothetical protein